MGEKPLRLILNIRLSDGSFDTELSVPLPKTEAEKEHAVGQWMELIRTGLKVSATDLRATLEPKP